MGDSSTQIGSTNIVQPEEQIFEKITSSNHQLSRALTTPTCNTNDTNDLTLTPNQNVETNVNESLYENDSSNATSYDTSMPKRRVFTPLLFYETNEFLGNIVKLKLPIKQNDQMKTITFLLDTGSDITAVRDVDLPYPNNIDTSEVMAMYGITELPAYTKGRCKLQLNFGDLNLSYNFHVLGDSFKVSHGIIGNDFLRYYNCKLDYSTNTLCLLNQVVELECSTQSNSKADIITLKPRTETVVSVTVANKNITEGIINKTKIQDGIYLPSSIVNVDSDGNAITTILNTTDEEIQLYKPEVNLETFQHLTQDQDNNVFCGQVTAKTPVDRIKILEETLRLDHLNEEEKKTLLPLCREFNSIFHLDGDDLPETSIVQHSIRTTHENPIATKTYRYPQVHKEEVHKQVNDMLEKGIIKHSTSPWSSPIWIVPKKPDASGKVKWRVVIDYRGLNSITVNDAFPLPNITEILDNLGKAKYFTCLDCFSGFHSIKMNEQDSPKTAFSTDIGHYQFNRMPFGLKNAPATYQRLMNTVLSGLQGTRCFVYMDDIVIFASDLQDHSSKLREVFLRIQEANLRLQPDKCEFLRKEITFLGHRITDQGIKPDQNKIKTVKDYPRPTKVKEVQSFLGLANYYRRFIKDFASISKPLTELTKKNTEFKWTDAHELAFETLKLKLISEPILQYPDFNQPFILTTDASSYAISGILSQGVIPNDLPISYASRTLNSAEINYPTIEKELLAIVWSVKHFRPYLYGRKFTIVTDHKPLIYLFRVKDPGSRLIKFRLKLEEYDYTIVHKPGKHNTNADALSRAYYPEDCLQEEPTPTKSESTQTVSPHLLVTRNSNLTYESFLHDIKTKVILNENILETSGNIQTCKDNIAIPIPSDLQCSEDSIANKIMSNHNYLTKLRDENPQIGNIITSKEKDRHVIFLVTKANQCGRTEYSDIFNILVLLRDYLINNHLTTVTLPKIGNEEKISWPKIRIMLRYIFKNTNIKVTVYSNQQRNPNPEEIFDILKEYHSAPHSGHFGFHKTYQKIKKDYYWPTMKNDIGEYIRTCSSCQRNKLIRKKHKEPMEITDTSQQTFQKVALDVVGPLTLTDSGNKYILTLQDNLTKFSQAYPIQNQEAETIAKVFVKEFICKFGLPQVILTDQGTNFTSNLFKSMAKLFKLKHVQCTAYHPQSNASLERSHATLVEYLRHFTDKTQTDWDEWIPTAILAYNTTPHTSTKFTPYELVFGFPPTLPTAITQPPEFRYTYDDFLSDLKLKLNKSHEIARENLERSKETNKTYYDKNATHNEYKIGDLVYLLVEHTTPGTSQKLRPLYEGPYEIISVDSPVNVTLKIKRKHVKVHTNRIKHFFVTGRY